MPWNLPSAAPKYLASRMKPEPVFMLEVWPLRLPRFVYSRSSGQGCMGSLRCTCQAVHRTLKGSSPSLVCILMAPMHTELRPKALILDLRVGRKWRRGGYLDLDFDGPWILQKFQFVVPVNHLNLACSWVEDLPYTPCHLLSAFAPTKHPSPLPLSRYPGICWHGMNSNVSAEVRSLRHSI